MIDDPLFTFSRFPLGSSRHDRFFRGEQCDENPAFAGLGQFTREGMLTTLVLLPLAIASTFAGVWLVCRIDADKFARILYVLMAVVGVRLVWVGVAPWL